MKNNTLSFLLCAMIPAFFACGGASPPATRPAKGRVIPVRDAAEFLKAIGSDRVLDLAAGEFVLPQATPAGHPHVSTRKVFDGHEVVVSGVKNLTIRGHGRATLLARPRYANVLTFENSTGIQISGIVAGHEQEGYCTGGVLVFRGGGGIRIERAELFGSGTEGLTLENVNDLVFDASAIRDCSYGIMTVRKSRDLVFRDASFRGNREFDLINIQDSAEIRFERVKISNNSTHLESYSDHALFYLRNSRNLSIRSSRINDNRAVYFQKYRGQAIRLHDTKVDPDQFERGMDFRLK